MLDDNQFSKIQQDIASRREKLAVKKAKMEEIKLQINVLSKEIIEKGILSAEEIQDLSKIQSKIASLEEEMLSYYERLKELTD